MLSYKRSFLHYRGVWRCNMPKSSNQKLKLIYLMKIFLERTDETHSGEKSVLEAKFDKSVLQGIDFKGEKAGEIIKKFMLKICYIELNL